MAARRRTIEDGVRTHFLLPQDLIDYLDQRSTEKGYGATRSSIVRELILRDKKEMKSDEENSNR